MLLAAAAASFSSPRFHNHSLANFTEKGRVHPSLSSASSVGFGRGLAASYTEHGKIQKYTLSSNALPPETAVASIIATAVVVGAAATLLLKRSKSPDTLESLTKPCDDCQGSGICPECKGEGFVLKKLSEQSADRARLLAKNMATRYTAGLPKKWSYCSKCSSSRSCRACGGAGRVSC